MNLNFFLALLLTVVPFIELRGGLPLAVVYSNEIGMPITLVFLIIVSLNILLIFFIFFFLDNLHKYFLKWSFYKRHFDKQLLKLQGKIDKFEKNYEKLGFWAMVFFVAVPLPGTGVYSGSLITWVLGLDRKKMILAISLGTIIAGILVLLATLGIVKLF